MLILLRTVIALALLAGITTTAVAQTHDYCENANRSVAILIDRTTAFDDLDRKFLEESVPAIDRHLTYGTYVVVRTIGEGFSLNRTEFEGCVPGCPDQGVMGGFFGSSCVPVRANAEKTEFRRNFFLKLKELSETTEQNSRSDIARTIMETSRSLNTAKRPLAELVVFSDMIDNVIVPQKVIYTQDPKRTLDATLKQNIKGELKGTNVSVFGFGRLDSAPRNSLTPDQYDKLRNFWLSWCKESSAAKCSLGVRLQ